MIALGGARATEVADARAYGADLISAYAMHDIGMDLVEITPRYDIGNITMIHAERLICNFIGASIRAGHCG